MEDLDRIVEFPYLCGTPADKGFEEWVWSEVAKSSTACDDSAIVWDVVTDIRSGDTVDVALDNALENHDLALDSAGRREARKRIFAMIRGLHMGQLNGTSCDDLVAAGVMSEVQATAFLKRFGVPGFDESMMRNGGAALRSAGLSGTEDSLREGPCREVRRDTQRGR